MLRQPGYQWLLPYSWPKGATSLSPNSPASPQGYCLHTWRRDYSRAVLGDAEELGRKDATWILCMSTRERAAVGFPVRVDGPADREAAELVAGLIRRRASTTRPRSDDGRAGHRSGHNTCETAPRMISRGPFLPGSGGRIRTYDLWVMSPASYRAAPPRVAVVATTVHPPETCPPPGVPGCRAAPEHGSTPADGVSRPARPGPAPAPGPGAWPLAAWKFFTAVSSACRAWPSEPRSPDCWAVRT